MFLPLRTDRPLRRTPLVTQWLIAINLFVYLVGLAGDYFGVMTFGALQNWGAFSFRDFQVWSLITYQFMHDPWSIGHLAFNMLFLWIFGCAVEDRLGRMGFLAFYLIGGIVAAIVHGFSTPAGVIGASGSISAVTGGFLALFPRSRIAVISIFGLFYVPSLFLIGLFFALDVIRFASDRFGFGGSNVAYLAHIAGYVYGFALCFAVLALRVIGHEDYDVFFLFKQARRRAAFRAAARQQVGGGWESASADTGTQLEKQSKKKRRAELDGEADPRVPALRAAISRHFERSDEDAAATAYTRLLQVDPNAVLSEDRQARVATRLYVAGDYPDSARAFERLLDTYRTHDPTMQSHLLLALMYIRYLDSPDRGRNLIEEIKPRIRDDAQKQLADQLLFEAGRTS